MKPLVVLNILSFIISINCEREVLVEKFSPIRTNDETFMDYGTFRAARKSKNLYILAGNLEFKRNVGDKTNVRYEVFNEQNQLVFFGEKSFCEWMKTDTIIYPDLSKASNMPDGRECPLKKVIHYRCFYY